MAMADGAVQRNRSDARGLTTGPVTLRQVAERAGVSPAAVSRAYQADAPISDIKEKYASRGTIDELDGVTVDCFEKEGWWANIRKSNTEPLLRLNLEARDKATLDSKFEEIAPQLGEQVDH